MRAGRRRLRGGAVFVVIVLVAANAITVGMVVGADAIVVAPMIIHGHQRAREGVGGMTVTGLVQQLIDGGDRGLDDEQGHEHGGDDRHGPTQPIVRAHDQDASDAEVVLSRLSASAAMGRAVTP